MELRRPHVHPDALLQIVLTPSETPAKGEPPPSNGPMIVRSRSPREVVFVANRRYFAAEIGQPMEIVERRYATVGQAIQALRRGEIQAIDRVNPWNLALLKDARHVTVQPYGMPLIHCLIPNVRRALTADRMFRRALVYGIHRQAILQQMLGVETVPGCAVTSSPFPLGVDSNDPMGYASDDSIEPRPYEPQLAMALAAVSLQNYWGAHPDIAAEMARQEAASKADAERREAERAEREEAGKQETATKPLQIGRTPETPDDKQKKKAAAARKPLPKMPKLVLAHPSDEIARAACASIQKQLDAVGIPVELRQLEGPPPDRVPDDVDLMYVELAVWEPVVDARRLFGDNGLVGRCGPYLGLALHQLDEATDWRQARDCLRRVHRIAHNDVAIIPLWQLMDSFAYHESLKGVAASPVSLYQNVEQWRPSLQYPAEK